MSTSNNDELGSMPLADLAQGAAMSSEESQTIDSPDNDSHSATELEAVFDIPVQVQAVLGKSSMEVNQLLRLSSGTVIELDRRVGEAIDIYVNDRLVARGEVVIVDEHLGVTMTEIVKQERAS